MKIATSIALIALSASLIQPSFAQQTPSPAAPGAQAQQTAPTPAQVDAQIAKMQELMTQMNQQMTQLQQTQDPEERQRLLQQHWTTMQEAMTAMHGMTELLLLTELDKQQREFATTIERSGDQLLQLVNDILDFSKIEAGQVALEEVGFELPALLAEVQQLFAVTLAR